MTGGCEGHANDAQRHATHSALQCDGTHAAADVHELIHFVQGVIHDHDAGRFRCDVAVLSDRHAHRGSHHGRGVVDAVSYIKSLGGGSFLADDRKLLFRAFLGVDFGNTHLLSEVTSLCLAISRHDHHPLELVLGTQMLHEGTALGSGRVAKAQGRRVAIVDYHHALEAAADRGELIEVSDPLYRE